MDSPISFSTRFERCFRITTRSASCNLAASQIAATGSPTRTSRVASFRPALPAIDIAWSRQNLTLPGITGDIGSESPSIRAYSAKPVSLSGTSPTATKLNLASICCAKFAARSAALHASSDPSTQHKTCEKRPVVDALMIRPIPGKVDQKREIRKERAQCRGRKRVTSRHMQRGQWTRADRVPSSSTPLQRIRDSLHLVKDQ